MEATIDHEHPQESSLLPTKRRSGIFLTPDRTHTHPDYQPFFKMLKVGVPMPVVQMKCSAAGLDGNLIENPDTIVA